MDSGCYTDPERESSGSSGRSFSASSKANDPKSQTSPKQVVLEEVVAEEYQPTVEEQLEYAATIGIDPESEPELMHLAAEGLKAALPPNWRPVQVSNGGDDLVYYFNFQTGQSTWEHPRDEHFRQLVVQERARLRTRRSNRSGRGVVRFQEDPAAECARRSRAAEEEKVAAAMRMELQSRLAAEEAELRAEMRARVAAEEAKLRTELQAQMETERRSLLQKLEQEAEDLREEQRRLLELETAERRVEAMAQLTELRAEVEQLKRTKATAIRHEQTVQSEETQSKPRCPRFRMPQRCVSVDESAVTSADNRDRSDIDEDLDDRSSGSRGGRLSVDAIGRARSFLSRHLSSERGFVKPNPPEPVAGASRKRPQLRASRASRRASPSNGSEYSVEGSLDTARMEVAYPDVASMVGASAEHDRRETGQEASAALAAELMKLRCNSLPSLAARLENEETTCSESSEQQPKAKQDRQSSAARQQRPAAQAQAASANPPNPRRHRIDWRKVGEKSDCPPQQQQQQSTESKLAQHRAWLYNYARLNGLPPSGSKPLTPQA
uniref:WW domain-containing protein n=1 Tax=Macrostomum lignano TaxID=282301 RepID=A0A1I8IEA8_9PLAT